MHTIKHVHFVVPMTTRKDPQRWYEIASNMHGRAQRLVNRQYKTPKESKRSKDLKDLKDLRRQIVFTSNAHEKMQHVKFSKTYAHVLVLPDCQFDNINVLSFLSHETKSPTVTLAYTTSTTSTLDCDKHFFGAGTVWYVVVQQQNEINQL